MKPQGKYQKKRIDAFNDMTKTIVLMFSVLTPEQQVYLRRHIGHEKNRYKMLRHLLDETAESRIKLVTKAVIAP